MVRLPAVALLMAFDAWQPVTVLCATPATQLQFVFDNVSAELNSPQLVRVMPRLARVSTVVGRLARVVPHGVLSDGNVPSQLVAQALDDVGRALQEPVIEPGFTSRWILWHACELPAAAGDAMLSMMTGAIQAVAPAAAAPLMRVRRSTPRRSAVVG